MSQEKDFKLSTTLYGHSLDVRYVDVNHNNYIISASRDKTCKYWAPNGVNPGNYTLVTTFKGHTNFVSSVCSLNPTPEFPDGVIISGGNDHNICVFTPDSSEALITLKGHTNTVCSIKRGNVPNTFLTSSWDCTAKLWMVSNTSLNEIITFSGHQLSVWAVLQLPNGNIITGSADKTIIIWLENGQKFKELKGHTDCVRDFAVINETCFASVSNDASIKLWTMDGACLNTLYGHSSFIYSISANKGLNNDGFVTCGEDRTVRCWQNGENTQTILLPAQSIWSVACTTDGDIVTGSSDGLVRVFTQDPNRIADEDQLKELQEAIEKLNNATNQEIGGVKISDLPGKEVLYEPGRSDGQTKLIREGDSVTCYSWSATEGTWNKIGDVMGAAGGTQETSGKSLHEGREYDFVFSVDIEDGKPPLKLPYNRSEDPWFAAQEFIHKNNLPQVYLDQVANFIVQNSGGSTAGADNASASSDFFDPFTGENRYVPGSATGSQKGSNSGSNLDPFTGTSSYTTSSTKLNITNTSNQQSIPTTETSYFPHLSYLYFEQANLSVIHEKLKEFNQKLNNEKLQVDDEILDGVVKLANGPQNDTCLLNLKKMLQSWPSEVVFPVLDITRLAVRHQENNIVLCSQTDGDGECLVQLLRSCMVQPSPANKMLALRILCNMFSHRPGEELILKHESTLCTDIAKMENNLNKNCQVALATFLLNLSIAFTRNQNSQHLLAMIEIISRTILTILSDAEAEFRAFVALGTVVVNVTKASIPKNSNHINQLLDKLQTICNTNSTDPTQLRNINCAQQLICILI